MIIEFRFRLFIPEIMGKPVAFCTHRHTVSEVRISDLIEISHLVAGPRYPATWYPAWCNRSPPSNPGMIL